MATIMEETDGYQKAFYSYQEVESAFSTLDVDEINDMLCSADQAATAGNVHTRIEDVGNGMTITVAW